MSATRRLGPFLPLLVLAAVCGDLAAQEPQQRPKDAEPQPLTALVDFKPARDEPGDDDLRKLLKEHYRAVAAEVALFSAEVQAGRTVLSTTMFDAMRRVVEAGLELSDNPDDKVALLTQGLELAKLVERYEAARTETGLGDRAMALRARSSRLEAEVRLLRAKREAEKTKGKP